MSIIVSREGKNAQKLDRTTIAQEEYLQNYIHYNPESLPLYEIKDDLRLLILSREFPTNSGPIDALGIDQDGNIYIIETKLYKNPDKRLVLAQVLDYGASLWRTYEDSIEFITRLENAVNKTFSLTLTEKVQDFYGANVETVAALLQNVRQNLNNGNFRFVVLMDHLEDRLRDLITFVNQNSRFDIFGVELEFYKFQEYEILIPKLYGAEVKKEASEVKSSGSRKSWNETLFFEEVDRNQSKQVSDSLRKLYSLSKNISDKIDFGSGVQRGSFNVKFDHISPRSLYTVYTDGTLSLNFGWLGYNENSDAVERFGQELRQLVGFNIPDNFQQKYISVNVEQWSPQINAFINAARTVARSKNRAAG